MAPGQADARPRLVQVLLKKAERLAHEDEQLRLYERVLALEKNVVAVGARTRIWKNRADRARIEMRHSDSVAAYEKAGLTDEAKATVVELRSKGLPALLARAEQQDRSEDHDAALDAIRIVSATVPGEDDWSQDIERLVRRRELAITYQRAAAALKSGDRDEAVRLLADVIHTSPRYKSATRLLLRGRCRRDD